MISLSSSFLLVCKDVTDFCMSILCPVTLKTHGLGIIKTLEV